MGNKTSKKYKVINVKPKGSLLNDKCHNKENIFGDTLNSKDGLVVIIMPTPNDKYIAYCYEYEELYDIFEKQNQVYEWNKGPIYNKRVYKEPYSGIWIDETSWNNLRIFNTLYAKPIKKTKIGSYFGMSHLHGADETIYKLYPINYSKFIYSEKITQDDINNFNPTKEDLNKNYSDKDLVLYLYG